MQNTFKSFNSLHNMDRFEYREARLVDSESYLKREKGVRLYDGDDKVNNTFYLITLLLTFLSR